MCCYLFWQSCLYFSTDLYTQHFAPTPKMVSSYQMYFNSTTNDMWKSMALLSLVNACLYTIFAFGRIVWIVRERSRKGEISLLTDSEIKAVQDLASKIEEGTWAKVTYVRAKIVAEGGSKQQEAKGVGVQEMSVRPEGTIQRERAVPAEKKQDDDSDYDNDL
jgi:hypothetical protein